MRIIHTSDWHLGKLLEGHDRYDEQKKFIYDFCDIVSQKEADMVIIAGDIYDNSNPSAKAETLFCEAINRLSSEGDRCVIVISGNHDNPDRLTSINPILSKSGVIILGYPQNYPKVGNYKGFSIIKSGKNFFEIEMKNERVVIVPLAYPSERRLNQVLYSNTDEKIMQSNYKSKIEYLLNKGAEKFREDTINIIVSHLFVLGGETSDSERLIQLGGSFSVPVSSFPKNADYIALGHLHRPQRISDKIIYSGSPIPYSLSEINYSKGIYQVDIDEHKNLNINEILLNNYKPIEKWKCNSIDEAIERCKDNSDRDCWVYLHIKTNRPLYQSEIKQIHKLKADVIEIFPEMEQENEQDINTLDYKEKSMKELFIDFYKHEKQIAPDDNLIEMFLNISEGDDDNETSLDEY